MLTEASMANIKHNSTKQTRGWDPSPCWKTKKERRRQLHFDADDADELFFWQN